MVRTAVSWRRPIIPGNSARAMSRYFTESNATTTRVLGADGHFYRRQLEGFASSVLDGAPMLGANIADGVASVRALVAIMQSAATGKPVRLADVDGAV